MDVSLLPTLRPGYELVGAFREMRMDENNLRVAIHDRFLLYPSVSDEAGVLREALADVPEGTRVGVLCLVINGRSRLFVRVEENQVVMAEATK